MLNQIIGESWINEIGQEFTKEYMQKLSTWVSYTRQSKTIYPESPDVFRALKLCPNGQVKVVILGQDPYYDGTADGLAFSYKDGVRPPGKKKSLDIILDEIERDCYDGFNVNRDYQLDYLAKQGVLLLNSVLTVFKGKPDSHKGMGWETLTERILLSQIIDKSPKVFMLWGNNAKDIFDSLSKKVVNLDYVTNYPVSYLLTNHLVLKAKHPASDLYNSDQFGDITPDFPNTFSGCKHFSQANDFLGKNDMTSINWFPIQEPYFNEPLDIGYPKSWNI
jgi:uracil-DNA glycosylase